MFTRLLLPVDFASDDTISVLTPFGVVVTLTNVVLGAGVVVVVVPTAPKLTRDVAIVVMLLAVVEAAELAGNVAITTDKVVVAAEFSDVTVTKFEDVSVEMALLYGVAAGDDAVLVETASGSMPFADTALLLLFAAVIEQFETFVAVLELESLAPSSLPFSSIFDSTLTSDGMDDDDGEAAEVLLLLVVVPPQVVEFMPESQVDEEVADDVDEVDEEVAPAEETDSNSVLLIAAEADDVDVVEVISDVLQMDADEQGRDVPVVSGPPLMLLLLLPLLLIVWLELLVEVDDVEFAARSRPPVFCCCSR